MNLDEIAKQKHIIEAIGMKVVKKTHTRLRK